MQFQIEALTEGRFKKPVVLEVPSQELNNAGQTKYNKAHFIAEFINVSKEEREDHQKKLSELQKQQEALSDDVTFDEASELKKAIEALQISFIQKYLVAVEKHPKHPFPFLNGEAEFKDVAALLDVRLFREAVSDAYNDEINKNQNEKMNKLLSGNLKP